MDIGGRYLTLYCKIIIPAPLLCTRRLVDHQRQQLIMIMISKSFYLSKTYQVHNNACLSLRKGFTKKEIFVCYSRLSRASYAGNKIVQLGEFNSLSPLRLLVCGRSICSKFTLASQTESLRTPLETRSILRLLCYSSFAYLL